MWRGWGGGGVGWHKQGRGCWAWAGPTPPHPPRIRRHLGAEAPHQYLKMMQSLHCTGWVLPALTFSAPSHLVVLASKGDSAGRGQR